MTTTVSLCDLQRQRDAQRSKPGSAGAWIEGIAFDLATASRVVPPDEVYAAIAAHRDEVLAEAAAIARQTPRPAESGRHWHWFGFAANRIADRLLAARTAR